MKTTPVKRGFKNNEDRDGPVSWRPCQSRESPCQSLCRNLDPVPSIGVATPWIVISYLEKLRLRRDVLNLVTTFFAHTCYFPFMWRVKGKEFSFVIQSPDSIVLNFQNNTVGERKTICGWNDIWKTVSCFSSALCQWVYFIIEPTKLINLVSLCYSARIANVGGDSR